MDRDGYCALVVRSLPRLRLSPALLFFLSSLATLHFVGGLSCAWEDAGQPTDVELPALIVCCANDSLGLACPPACVTPVWAPHTLHALSLDCYLECLCVCMCAPLRAAASRQPTTYTLACV